ncbi:radial spoke head 1 homolog isoform X1 [Rhopilema esculentum]|uniref:radial spoke head 1 homolog isoform X1 n=1 Tax=Rhopilema esculentum TaxID=499914 RepID=UPI0031D412C4|eukprot:gene4653-20934_t
MLLEFDVTWNLGIVPHRSRFKNGGKYVGGYAYGKKQGEGTLYYPDGSRYEGSWSNNARNGYGSYFYVNGDIYEGDWVDNKKEGQGIYTYAATGSKYRCRWIAGQLEGPGEFLNQNYRFVGNYEKSLPTGSGRFLFDNGSEQIGEYIVKEEIQEAEVEGEEAVVVKTPTWKASAITSLQKVEVDLGDM